MLDQVKSGTSARTATIRPAAGVLPAAESPLSQRVNPASGGMGTDHDKSPGDEPRDQRRRRGDREALGSSPGASDIAAKVLSATSDPDARRSADDAVKELLREAGEMATAAAPAPVPVPAGPGDAHQKGVDVYAERENRHQRREVLKPGAVFSASF